MKKTTVLIVAVLAIATVLTAGLTVLPGSVQEAQANPCSNNANGEAEEDSEANEGTVETGEGQECTLIEVTTGNNIIDDPLFDLADAFDESD